MKNIKAPLLLTLALCALIFLGFVPSCSSTSPAAPAVPAPTATPPPVTSNPPVTPDTTENQTATVAETVPPTEPPHETWYQVDSFDGIVSETTPNFHIYGTEWNLKWNIDADDLNTAVFKLDIFPKAQPFALWRTISNGGASSGTENYYMSITDKRDFFIKITSLNVKHWTIEIEDNAIAATAYPVQITYINYRGTYYPPDPPGGFCYERVEPDEYVVIKNLSDCAVEMTGWTLKNISRATPYFKFPSGYILPGGIIRVYTDEVHPETGGFTFFYGFGDLWRNDNPDIAVLYDAQGNEVSQKSYTLPMKLNEPAE